MSSRICEPMAELAAASRAATQEMALAEEQMTMAALASDWISKQAREFNSALESQEMTARNLPILCLQLQPKDAILLLLCVC